MYMSSKEFDFRRMLRFYKSDSDYRKVCETFIAWFPEDKDLIIKLASERGFVYVERFGFFEPDEYKELMASPVS